MTVIRLRDRAARAGQPEGDEDRTLTPIEQALVKVRLAAFSALEAGATRAEVEAEIADAVRLHLRMTAR